MHIQCAFDRYLQNDEIIIRYTSYSHNYVNKYWNNLIQFEPFDGVSIVFGNGGINRPAEGAECAGLGNIAIYIGFSAMHRTRYEFRVHYRQRSCSDLYSHR